MTMPICKLAALPLLKNSQHAQGTQSFSNLRCPKLMYEHCRCWLARCTPRMPKNAEYTLHNLQVRCPVWGSAISSLNPQPTCPCHSSLKIKNEAISLQTVRIKSGFVGHVFPNRATRPKPQQQKQSSAQKSRVSARSRKCNEKCTKATIFGALLEIAEDSLSHSLVFLLFAFCGSI